FSAIKNNDRVGLQLFTDNVERVVPPSKGTCHVLRVIRELLFCEPIGRGTDIKKAIEHLNRTAKRRSVVFLISDFQDTGYETALRIARRKHDIIPIVIGDLREAEMPNVGIVELHDSETGEKVLLDTSSRRHRALYARRMRDLADARRAMFTRLKMDPIYLFTGEDMIDPLRKFFHKREARR
ncbi:MAG: VWA domain-containing protein, partial [Pirellulales bacterium]|nr:VWA domain-containing protein [Pirellulales bacterium]